MSTPNFPTVESVESVETPEETPAEPEFDYVGWLDEFAAKGAGADPVVGPFLSQVWPQMKSLLEALDGISEKLRKLSPPTDKELADFAESEDGAKDSAIAAATAKIKEYADAISKITAARNARALELLGSEVTPPEEIEGLKTEFKNDREVLKSQLDAALNVAKVMGKTELYDALDAVDVPRMNRGMGTGTASPARNDHAKVVREWAKTRPEFKDLINERGRIHDKIWVAAREAGVYDPKA